MLIFLMFAALTAKGEKHKSFSSLKLLCAHFTLQPNLPWNYVFVFFPLLCDFSAGWVGVSQWWYAEYCYGKSCWGCRGTLSFLLALAGTAKYHQKANMIKKNWLQCWKNCSKICDGDFYNIFTLIWMKLKRNLFFQILKILYTHQWNINYYE